MKCARCGAEGELGKMFRVPGDWCKACNRKETARWQKATNERSRPGAHHIWQHWTSEELNVLQQCMELKLSPVEITSLIPRTWASIRAKMFQLRHEGE